MSYRWEPVGGGTTAAGLEAAGLGPRFEDQSSAEQWLTAFYDEIAEAGVTDATITRHARRVVDERQLLADEAIEQCRLADVRPSDNGDGRLGCHGWALPSTNDAATGRTPAAALNFQLEPHGMTGAAHELT